MPAKAGAERSAPVSTIAIVVRAAAARIARRNTVDAGRVPLPLVRAARQESRRRRASAPERPLRRVRECGAHRRCRSRLEAHRMYRGRVAGRPHLGHMEGTDVLHEHRGMADERSPKRGRGRIGDLDRRGHAGRFSPVVARADGERPMRRAREPQPDAWSVRSSGVPPLPSPRRTQHCRAAGSRVDRPNDQSWGDVRGTAKPVARPQAKGS